MYAVEFRAKVKNGVIEVPKKFRGAIIDNVKVIILKDEATSLEAGKKSGPDMIETLLTSPLEIKGFHPLQREEIYDR